MSAPKVRRKWRPTLGLIVVCVLLAVLALPAGLVIWFRSLDATTSRMGQVEFGALGLAVLATLAIAYVFTRTITGPIEALVTRTEEIGRGGRAAIQPLDTYGTREIATLSQSFLDLAGRLVDRSEYVRSFAAHVSHELKSPLTAIKGAAELLRDEDEAMTPDERARFLGNIVADADRLNALVGRLRELAQAELPMAAGTTSVAEIERELAARFPRLAIAGAGEVVERLAISLEAATIIFGHLADNAGQHGADELRLNAEAGEAMVRIEVRDNGRGISPGNRDRVFQPFFSTRREQGGTGMGLDIARAMLNAHGGTIVLLEAEGGAAFALTLPKG